MAFNGFGKNSGPSVPLQSQTLFGSSPLHTSTSDLLKEPIPSGHPSQSLLPLSSYTGLQDVPTSIPVKPSNIPLSKRPRSPPVQSANRVSLSSPHDTARLDTRTNSLFDNRHSEATKRTRSPSFVHDNSQSDRGLNQLFRDGQRSMVSPPRWANQSRSPNNTAVIETHLLSSSIASDSDTPNVATGSHIKNASFNAPRRTPSLPVQDDIEREAQAKAKRLARFKEPSKPAEEFSKNRSNVNEQSQAPEKKQKNSAHQYVEEVSIASNKGVLGDNDDLESSTVVVGFCQDMCPESERDERERKGDLDKYERLDGDRNQTTKYLAVKKYTRTAEREAMLIRPMPVLQKTIMYLLGLLNQPYDERFLGIYNFLWDRMRAIRMDLRMQHLFNQEAIVMLEQMIRLHIIAMHELCEYAKGEGFSEGFDAHLNIEQMNKASVELFQMYDDHRKRGIRVPTEQEFRGYYALLKLDKHPGYKVEPAELSLDLAKMTPEIKGSPDVMFARDVARSCRTGNYIAFFRHARNSTYLQACLMHAHFSKLRTQALASLHSGLQNNQGIPIPEVVNWLAMEEEDIEYLLDYHGFSIKNFGVPYMVKEGPFLNSDNDHPNRCSSLVHLKKSRKILDDVCSPQIPHLSTDVRQNVYAPKKLPSFVDRSTRSTEMDPLVDEWDDEMLDFEDAPIASEVFTVKALPEAPFPDIQKTESESQASEVLCMSPCEPSGSPAKVGTLGVSTLDTSNSHLSGSEFGKQHSSHKETLPTSAIQSFSHYETPSESVPPENVHCTPTKLMVQRSSFQKPLQFARGSPPEMLLTEGSLTQRDVIKHIENEVMLVDEQNEEVAFAKLRLILRIWRRRCSKLRDLKKQQQLLSASAALSSLSLGPPIRQCKSQLVHTGELNIDCVLKQRLDRRSKSWSKINVAQVVGQILSEKNPLAKCLCWKLVICSQVNHTAESEATNHSACKWLLSKLMSTGRKDDTELAFSSSSISIWKYWILSQVNKHQKCILSVIRDVQLEGSMVIEKDIWGGAGAILFLVLKHLPWDLQRAQLHNLASTVPINSCLPLLVLVSGMPEELSSNPSHMTVDRLDLYSLDKSRISSFMVVYLSGDELHQRLNGFFSDGRLREGLKWLADNAPIQPVLHEVSIHELTLSCSATSLKELGCREISTVEPRHCISAFNEALEHAVEEILTAADKNPTGWPCSEIQLLEESTYEQVMVSSFLPSIGWSSAERIMSTIKRIKGCKLPLVGNNMSWLGQGSLMGKEIQPECIVTKKLELKRFLISYLTGAMLMPAETAEREADMMLQNAILERNDLSYRIIPKWVTIFRRIYNWRLENLIGGNFSSTFVLENQSKSGSDSDPSEFDTRETRERDHYLNLLDPIQSNYELNHPSLDELIEVCHLAITNPVSFQPQQESGEGGEALGTVISSIAGGFRNLGVPPVVEASDTHLSTIRNEESSKVVEKGNKTSRLDTLFQQCTFLQDRIDEKLKFYF
ncbi:SAC3 family protein B isoform X2 [Aristolochia californica]|uniref:SAC3 family protein B isoform X2 n=1 Tax=Aristolochia californica TaxID=171875 RepID=UPI0035E03B1C